MTAGKVLRVGSLNDADCQDVDNILKELKSVT